VATDGLVKGKTYRFISRAINTIGESEFSTEAYIAFGGVPPQLDPPTRISSTTTSIYLEWTPPVLGVDDLEVTGYVLNRDDG
jgi:hypothetical protein